VHAQQGPRLFALPRRQDQHQWIAGAGCGGIGDHLQAAALEFIGEWLVALFAHQLRSRELAYRRAFTRTQEQHRSLRPSQGATGKRKEKGVERGIGVAGGQEASPGKNQG